jgi:fructose-1,6-bisphosphatase/inositol monophosphatase family enzyme
MRQADTLRLVQGLVGYATSLAAVENDAALAGVVTREIPAAQRYVAERGTTVKDLVERKRRERLSSARWDGAPEATQSAGGRNA